MPKRRWKIDRFEGGLNNVSDPRDVQDNELSYSSRFMVDKTGKLRTSAAGMTAMSSSPTGAEEVTGAGQLAVWHSDYLFNAASTTTTSGSSNIAFGNSTNSTAKVDIRGGTGTWHDDAVTVNGSAAVEMNFYSADGVLRSGDATTSDCHASSRPKWTGYIQRNTFNNVDATNGPTNSDIDVDGVWHTTDTTLLAPTLLMVGDGGGVHTAVTSATNLPANYGNGSGSDADLEGNGFNAVILNEYKGLGTWQAGTYKVASTFIYDNNQESLPFVPTTNNEFTIAADNVSFNGYGYFQGDNTGGDTYEARITGARLYYKSEDAPSDPWKLLVHFDMVTKGAITTSPDTKWVTPDTSDGSAWTAEASGTVGEGAWCLFYTTAPLLDTYESLNGFSSGLRSISFDANGQGWVDSVVANRRVFLAAPTHTNIDGDAHKNHDRILYSEVGKFDTFPNINYLDIGIDDGESFTAVDSFADRILAFKQRTLYIINVASGSDTNWYLESQHSGYGVHGTPATVRTPLGIAFVNTSGCFVYDGSKITDLTKKLAKLGTSADLDDWVTFITNNAQTYNPSIGWSNKNQQLIVMSSIGNTGTYEGNAFIYDINTGSWTFHLDFFTDGDTYTNFINYGTGTNEDMIVGQVTSSALDLKKYVPASGSVAAELQTKDMDFGDPGIIKKIYNVYLTYRSSGALTTPFTYAVDGTNNFSGAGGGTFTGNLIDTSNVWDVATLTTSTPISCQSLQIKYAATQQVEINDMAIEYRPLYKRVS